MSFKGISADNDVRFTNAEKKLLKSTKFPDEFRIKVDMSKVNADVLRPWINTKITGLLGFEDDVVVEMILQMLAESRFPDPKKIQLALAGFLYKDAPNLLRELWQLLIGAQESPEGIAISMIEGKKDEILQRRYASTKFARAQDNIGTVRSASQALLPPWSNRKHPSIKQEFAREDDAIAEEGRENNGGHAYLDRALQVKHGELRSSRQDSGKSQYPRPRSPSPCLEDFASQHRVKHHDHHERSKRDHRHYDSRERSRSRRRHRHSYRHSSRDRSDSHRHKKHSPPTSSREARKWHEDELDRELSRHRTARRHEPSNPMRSRSRSSSHDRKHTRKTDSNQDSESLL